MKILISLSILLLFLFACKSRVETTTDEQLLDTIAIDNTRTDTVFIDSIGISPKYYANERFKDVTVEKTGDNTFRITGKGQIFEANFGWVIEDGHDELQSGNVMTDAGAPEWGNFSFTVTAPKNDPNSTLHIILYESSPKDGRRLFELPIPLY